MVHMPIATGTTVLHRRSTRQGAFYGITTIMLYYTVLSIDSVYGVEADVVWVNGNRQSTHTVVLIVSNDNTIDSVMVVNSIMDATKS